jgi:hypothetical protein
VPALLLRAVPRQRIRRAAAPNRTGPHCHIRIDAITR